MRSQNTNLCSLMAALAACCALPWVPVYGDQSDANATDAIEQIVVVAHKDARPAREIAGNVSVLSRTALQTEMALSMSDVFRYAPGIDYEAAGTRFGTEGLNIRGIGGNRVAILVDGVPLADQFDTGSFSNATRDFIDAGLIQNVEVLRGPASALYGSAAIGGVVAVSTPDPDDLRNGNGIGGDAAFAWRGADTSRQGQFLFAGGSNALGFVAGFSHRDGEQLDSARVTDNIDTRDYERQTALLKLVADNRWGHTLRVTLMHQESATLSSLRSLLGSGRYRSTTALEGDDKASADVVSVAYEFGGPGSVFDTGVARAFWQSSQTEQSSLDERGNARRPASIQRYFSYQQKIIGAELNVWKNFDTGALSHRLGSGIELRERRTEEFRDGLSTSLTTGVQTNVLLGEVFPLRDFPISDTREAAVFVEDTISVGDLTIIAALRAERYDLSPRVDAMYTADYPNYRPVSMTESDLSPKLGLIYDLGNGFDVYAQYAHGFRAPPYSDANVSLEIPFFAYRAIPNPDLKSETSDGYEIGLRWQGESASFFLTAFRTDYADFIETKVNLGTDAVSGYTLFQSQNIRDTRIEGLEAGWKSRFGSSERFGVDASAYYARGDNNVTGQPLNSVGPPQAVFGADWLSLDERRQLRLKVTLTGAYDRRDDSTGELFEPAGHAIVDLYLSQKFGQRTLLRAGLHNLTDRSYWHWSDVRGLGAEDPVLPFLAQAGRSLSLGLSVVW